MDQVKSGKGTKASGAGVEGDSQLVTESIFPELLNAQHDKYDTFKSDANVLLPEKITDRPKRRLRHMEQLRTDLMGMIDDVNEKVAEINRTIKDNQFNS